MLEVNCGSRPLMSGSLFDCIKLSEYDNINKLFSSPNVGVSIRLLIHQKEI